jgi:hypothetical protein
MKKLIAVPAAIVVVAVMASPSVAATASPASFQAVQSQAAPAPTTQGIIMRDGGICDPIRWGC